MPESLREHLRAATAALGSDSARLDAELLLAHALGWPRSRLYARAEEPLPDAAARRLAELINARRAGRPAAYLLGEQEFWSLSFEVSPDCLIPRPETEGLVEFALDHGDAGARALDLGTGSGAIAIALAHERPDWTLTAVDSSSAALALAARNGRRHGVAVRWLEGDWFTPVASERFELILSNPPYVAIGDPHLTDLEFEPATALVAGDDGLDALRHIAAAAPAHLAPGGWLALEHGAEQGPAVRTLLTTAGLVDSATRRDLAGLERISAGRRP